MQDTKDIIFKIQTIGENPLAENAKIVAIAVKFGDNPIVVLTEETEKELLQKFFGMVCFEGFFKLIGFNSSAFDLPFLIVRSLKYGIRIPDLRGKCIDLKHILTFGDNFKAGRLNEYASLFLNKNLIRTNENTNVKTLYNSGKWDELETFCGNDAFLICKIYERLKKMGVL